MKLPFRPDVVDGVMLQMEPGTTGGSKIWLGKDYSNPVNRDFFEVNKPFEGNERYTVEPPCATISRARLPPISNYRFKTPNVSQSKPRVETSSKRPPPVSEVFAFWVVAYGRFDYTL